MTWWCVGDFFLWFKCFSGASWCSENQTVFMTPSENTFTHTYSYTGRNKNAKIEIAHQEQKPLTHTYKLMTVQSQFGLAERNLQCADSRGLDFHLLKIRNQEFHYAGAQHECIITAIIKINTLGFVRGKNWILCKMWWLGTKFKQNNLQHRNEKKQHNLN